MLVTAPTVISIPSEKTQLFWPMLPNDASSLWWEADRVMALVLRGRTSRLLLPWVKSGRSCYLLVPCLLCFSVSLIRSWSVAFFPQRTGYRFGVLFSPHPLLRAEDRIDFFCPSLMFSSCLS